MTVVGNAVSYYKRFKFIVEVDGVPNAGFESAGPLESETAVVEQWGGGGLVPQAKDPGRVTFPDLVLSRGASKNLDLFNWYKQVSDLAKNAGNVDPTYKKNIDIVQQDRDGTTLCRWRIFQAWPKKYTAGAWDNKADENVMEELTLAYRYFDIVAS